MSPGSSVVTTVDVVNNFNSSKQHIRSASGTVLTDSIEEILKQVRLVFELFLLGALFNFVGYIWKKHMVRLFIA